MKTVPSLWPPQQQSIVSSTSSSHPREPSFVVNVDDAEISAAQKLKLKESLDEAFAHHQYDLGCCTASEVHIRTATETPEPVKPRRLPIRYQAIVEEHVNKLIEAGILTESDTPWVHNLAVVGKKDGSYRLCMDMRNPPNMVSESDPFPTPLVEHVLQKVEGCKYFTSLDLCRGYWPLHLQTYKFVRRGK